MEPNKVLMPKQTEADTSKIVGLIKGHTTGLSYIAQPDGSYKLPNSIIDKIRAAHFKEIGINNTLNNILQAQNIARMEIGMESARTWNTILEDLGLNAADGWNADPFTGVIRRVNPSSQ